MSKVLKVQNDYSAVGEPTKGYGLGHRHFQTFLVFLLVAVGYIMRVNMSVAIIAMTDTSSNTTHVQVFDWDKKTQDYILSAFYWGYMLTQIPVGYMANRFGPKILLVIAMLANGSICIVLPYAVHFGGWKAAFACRMGQGLTQSCLMPSGHAMLSKWAPVSERSRLGYFVQSGSTVGTVVGLPLVGFLANRFGWAVSFQAIGGFALFTGMLWSWFGSNRPALHSSISLEERNYIETSLGQTRGHKVLKTPWKSIATSVPIWALLVVQIGSNYGFVAMLLETPSFLKMALGVNMQMSGIYSAMPYAMMCLFGVIISFLSDYSVNKKIISITVARRIATSIGTFGYGGALVSLGFIPTENIPLSVAVLTLAIGLCAGQSVGMMLNHIDLSPNFAGILMAIGNATANLISTLAPISIGFILTDPTDHTQWRIVFIQIAVIMTLANMVFLIWGSGEKQPWNDPNEYYDIDMKTTSQQKGEKNGQQRK